MQGIYRGIHGDGETKQLAHCINTHDTAGKPGGRYTPLSPSLKQPALHMQRRCLMLLPKLLRFVPDLFTGRNDSI
jgi:hypothetical protein